MGDRTPVYIVVHPDDLVLPIWERFIKRNGASAWGEGVPNRWVGEKCDYALGNDIDELAEAGMRFFGHHDNGFYNASDFFSDHSDRKAHYGEYWSGNRIVVDCTENGMPETKSIIEEVDLLRRYRNIRETIEFSENKEVH
jgi:hypothetical protein